MWSTCQCKQNRFLNMYSSLKESPHDFVLICKEIEDVVSLKTRKLHLHSSESFDWDHRSTNMQLSWIVFVVSIFIYLFLLLWLRIFFQGEEEDSDKIIRMERATPLFSADVVLDQRSDMIGTATAADDNLSISDAERFANTPYFHQASERSWERYETVSEMSSNSFDQEVSPARCYLDVIMISLIFLVCFFV